MYHSLIPRPAFHRPAKKKSGPGYEASMYQGSAKGGGGDLGNKGVQNVKC